MISSNDISALLIQFLTAAPYIIVCLVAFIFSLIRYRECPNAYMMAAIGSLVLLMTRGAQIFVYFWLPRMAMERNMTSMSMGQIYSVTSIVFTITTSLALAAIVAAVFIGRPRAARN